MLALDDRISAAGLGLGELSIQWGRRPAVRPPCQVTDRDRQVLSLVHDFGYLTTSILASLVWGGYGTVVRRRLKLLHDVGYLDKLRPRISRTQGTREWIYRLSPAGWNLLLDAGSAADGEDYTPAELTSISYVEHDVQVAALVTRLAAITARRLGRAGPLIEAAPFGVLGPRSSASDPWSARPEASSPSAALDDRRIHLESAVPGRIEPDATLIGTTPDGKRTAVMIEYDRTRRASKMQTKLRRYDHFLTAGWREGRYASLDIEPVLLVVCASERQVRVFAERADTDLGAWIGGRSTERRNGEHPGREQTGFTSRDRLLVSDWRLLQVPAVPPALRQRGTRRETSSALRETALDLTRLFASPIQMP